MKCVRISDDEHIALCNLIQQRIREYEDIAIIENSKVFENASMFNSVILAASHKAKTFALAYQSLLDSLMRYEDCE